MATIMLQTHPPTNPHSQKEETGRFDQLQVTASNCNSNQLQITSISEFHRKQPCNNRAENHSKVAEE